MARPPRPGEPRRWWTDAEWRASEARDHTRRERLTWPASTSTTPRRCATCGHWNAQTAWLCADCGLRFVARPLAR